MRQVLVLVTALVASAVGAPSWAQAPTPTCQGTRVTIQGTAGDDTILGTRGRDVILGGPGDDTLLGLAGNDLICGGKGDDEVDGGRGDDELRGGSQTRTGDLLRGGAGSDRLVPGLDRDRDHQARDGLTWSREAAGVSVSVPRGTAVSAGRTNDRDTLVVEDSTEFTLTDHDDRIVATPERDFVYPRDGRDRIWTVGGSDRVYFASDEADDGLDRVHLGGDKDRVSHFVGALQAWGGPGRDRLFQRGTGPNELAGGGGPDWLHVIVTVRPGQRLTGGPGHDELTVKGLAKDIAWDMASGRAWLGNEPVEALIAGVERAHVAEAGGELTVTGTKGDDRIRSRKRATFSGRAGDDVFLGSREDDHFDGGRGRDEYDDDPGTGDVNTCVSVERDPRSSCATP